MKNLSDWNLMEIGWSPSADLRQKPNALSSEMENAILLPARDVSKDSSDQPLATLFDYLKENGVVFIEEGDAVEGGGKGLLPVDRRSL